MSSKKAAAARRGGAALDAFERALRAMGKKDYQGARDLFDGLLAAHGEEREIVERARSYRAACDRALKDSRKTTYRPKAFEDLLAHGVYLHNRGEFAEALKALRQAAEMQPKNEHALYCIAATSARAGDAAGALRSLRAAIAQSPAVRAQARSDSDFDALREDEEFQALLRPQAS